MHAPISAQCRQGRHGACFKGEDQCDCECHDPVERGSVAAPKIGDTLKPAEVRAALNEMEPPPAGMGIIRPSQAELEQFPCPHCDHLPFSTKQGIAVHIARMHKHGEPAAYAPLPPEPEEPEIEHDSPPPPIEFLEVPSPPEYLEAELRGLRADELAAGLATEVLDAVEFLERRDREEIIDEALGSWAAHMMAADAEVHALVEIRRKYRERRETT